jgi:hypothetical protein
MSQAVETPERDAIVRPSPALAEQLGAVRQKHLFVQCGGGVALALGALALALMAGALLDWWIELPWAVRALLLAADIALVGYILWNYVVVPYQEQPDDDSVALVVEKGKPEFRSRLIASLQLTRPESAQPNMAMILVQRLVLETEKLADSMDFTEVISTERFKRIALYAAVFVGAAIFLYAKGEDVSRDLLRRALLSRDTPVPRKTRVVWTTGDLKVGRGDTILLEALAKGVIPENGTLVARYSISRSVEYPMDVNATNNTRFSRAFENVQESFSYVVQLNDGRSRSAEVTVVDRPSLVGIECVQVFPEYTKLGTVKRSPGDLLLLAGSKLQVKATANKAMQSVVVRTVGVTNEIAAVVNTANAAESVAEILIPTNALSGFSVHLLDRDGFESRDDAIYRIDILPDKAPVVRITYPDRREELITQRATVLVGFEAFDDFAINKVFLKYRIEGGDEKSVEMILEDTTQRAMRRRYDWKVGAIKPLVPIGNSIEYWIEVQDNNNVTGPGIGSSEHYAAKVVSDEEKRADLMNRVGDYIGNVGDVAKDQETLNKRLGNVILGRPEQK